VPPPGNAQAPAPGPASTQYVVVATDGGKQMLVPLHDVESAPAPAPALSSSEIKHLVQTVRARAAAGAGAR